MAEESLIINVDQCVRCHACEIACQQEHDAGSLTNPPRCTVLTVGPRDIGDRLFLDFVPLLCFHCDVPACLSACPAGAIAVKEDGIVTIDEASCTGCGICVGACPYGAMFLDAEKKSPVNCDLCSGRRACGQEPACVKHCIGRALEIAGPERVSEIISSGIHSARIGKVWYVSSGWKLEKPW